MRKGEEQECEEEAGESDAEEALQADRGSGEQAARRRQQQQQPGEAIGRQPVPGGARDHQPGEAALHHRHRHPAARAARRNLLPDLQAAERQREQEQPRARLDPALAVRGLLRAKRQVRQVSAQLHSARPARLRALLRPAPPAHLHQRRAQPAAVVARAPGHQVQEAPHAAHHLHGRQHQDPVSYSLQADPIYLLNLRLM